MRLARDTLHALAAEYVVGTLRGRARRRFEAMARADRDVAAIVERWEAELTPLAERVSPVEPPARVWGAIEARIAAPRSAAGSSADAFWRTFGMLAAGLASVLVVAFLWLSPQREAEPVFVAVLTASDAVPRMVVSMHAGNEMRIRVVKPWQGTEGKSLELWALAKNGAPRSLGLVGNEHDTLLRVSASDARLLAANALAVSLEPRGGSPSGQPTGPVLCSGSIAATRKT